MDASLHLRGARFLSNMTNQTHKMGLFMYRQDGKDAEFTAFVWFYFANICTLAIIATVYVIPACVVFLRRRVKNVCQLKDVRKAVQRHPKAAITGIMPCFLPNEQDIMEDTAMHILEHVASPGDFKLHIVYNTPPPMPDVEARLKALEGEHFGRQLKVSKCVGSRSKAENLNYAIPYVDDSYVVLYDADHNPDADSLLYLYEKLERKGLDCVQGSTYIRNITESLLARFVDAEFFIQHFLIFPAMKFATRSAFFGGSNALWRTNVIAQKTFNEKLQCEDVDFAIRMLLDDKKIDFCPEARSGELVPGSLKALYKQRLRWALGWDQISQKYWEEVLAAKSTVHCCKWLGLLNMFYFRIITMFVTFWGIIGCPVFVLFSEEFQDVTSMGPAIMAIRRYLSICLLTHLLICTAEAICQLHHRGKQSGLQAFYVILFIAVGGLLYIPYQFWLQSLSLYKVMSGQVGEWVVTRRESVTVGMKISNSSNSVSTAASLTGESGMRRDASDSSIFTSTSECASKDGSLIAPLLG